MDQLNQCLCELNKSEAIEIILTALLIAFSIIILLYNVIYAIIQRDLGIFAYILTLISLSIIILIS